MAKAFIKYDFTAITNQVICTWAEAGNPNAELGRKVINGTTVPKAGGFTAIDINPVMHTFKFFQSADGINLQSFILQMDIDASQSTNNIVESYRFVVGSGLLVEDGVHTAPAQGDTYYFNNKLSGSDISLAIVNKPGYGLLSWGSNISSSGTPTGGFQLIDGQIFNTGEEYTIVVFRQVTTQQATPQANLFAGVKLLTADITFDSTYWNQLLSAGWSAPKGTITVPPFNTITSGKRLKLVTHDGVQNAVSILFTGTDRVAQFGGLKSALHLGKGETIEIYFDGGKGYLLTSPEGYEKLGQIRLGYKALPNEVLLDGSELSIASNPRLKELYDSLPVNCTIPYANWGDTQEVTLFDDVKRTVYKNKGFFAITPDAQKIKLPDMRGAFLRVLKTFDGALDTERLANYAGAYQWEQIIAHRHQLGTAGDQSSVDPARSIQRSYREPDPYYDGGGLSPWMKTAGGVETRPGNIGLNAYLSI